MLPESSKFIDFLNREGKSKETIRTYLVYCHKFKLGFDSFKQATVNTFIDSPYNNNMPAKAFLLAYKRFLLLNKIELGLSPQEIDEIERTNIPKILARPKSRLPQYLTPDQIEKVKNAIENPKDKLMFTLTYNLGLRAGELLRIRLNSFNWDLWNKDKEKAGEVKVIGKGNIEAIALVPSSVMKEVKEYIFNLSGKTYNSPEDYLFLDNEKDNFNTISRTWRRNIKRAGNLVGISYVHPHILRHSYATYMFSKGTDIRNIQELLRHKDIQSTQIYTHIDKEKLKELVPNRLDSA